MKYEILFIVRPDLEENAIKDVFKNFLSSNYRMFSFGMYGSEPEGK